MKRHIAYFRSVMCHKWFVLQECIKLGVPLWRAIIHDWDKFLPDEWLPYARCFYTPDGGKQYQESPAFARAWLLHQRRNPHHYQFWLLTWDRGTTEPLPMPDVYRREMLADWRGAGRAYNADWQPSETAKWYLSRREMFRTLLHPETRAWIEQQLGVNDAE